MNSETNTDQPPTLPDTSTWVRRAPGDVIEAGTPYLYVSVDGKSFSIHAPDDVDWWATAPGTYWTPPPAPSEPWSSISTDRDKPTLARVTLGETLDHVRWPNPAEWVVEDNGLYAHWSDDWMFVAHVSHITHVELLRPCPETHVPVERALIQEYEAFVERAKDILKYQSLGHDAPIVQDLASLASDESSASDGGRS